MSIAVKWRAWAYIWLLWWIIRLSYKETNASNVAIKMLCRLRRKTIQSENLRDFPKRCKCSLDVLSGDLRAQITHKYMEVIWSERKRQGTVNNVPQLTLISVNQTVKTRTLTGSIFLLTTWSGGPVYFDLLYAVSSKSTFIFWEQTLGISEMVEPRELSYLS